MLYIIDNIFGDIEGKFVVDLGCGCGVLSIGLCMFESVMIIGFDVDCDVLEIVFRNCVDFEIILCEFV